MPRNSVNTNGSALIALQSLNQTQAKLDVTQNRINTGLKIASARDNAAIWAIAETVRAQISSLGAATSSLQNAKSTLDTTQNAGKQLTGILRELRDKALAASDTGTDQASRAKFQAEFVALAQSYSNVIAAATFNGTNLLSASIASGSVNAIGDANGSIKINAAHRAINAATLFGSDVLNITAGTIPATSSVDVPDTVNGIGGDSWTTSDVIANAANAAAAVIAVDNALRSVTDALAAFGTSARQVEIQIDLVSNLSDALTEGVGNLVDADLAKESANLQALQVQQQLGVQALGIANQRPQILLNLFQ